MNGDQSGQNTMGTDPGEVENLLTLNPQQDDWAETIGNWQDGEEYELKLKVRQLEPGKFEVISAEPIGGAADAETSADDSAEGGTEEPADTGEEAYANPAVARMVKSKTG